MKHLENITELTHNHHSLFLHNTPHSIRPTWNQSNLNLVNGVTCLSFFFIAELRLVQRLTLIFTSSIHPYICRQTLPFLSQFRCPAAVGMTFLDHPTLESLRIVIGQPWS